MKELQSERVITPLSPSLLLAIEDFRFQQRCISRSEAIRRLIALGVESAVKAELMAEPGAEKSGGLVPSMPASIPQNKPHTPTLVDFYETWSWADNDARAAFLKAVSDAYPGFPAPAPVWIGSPPEGSPFINNAPGHLIEFYAMSSPEVRAECLAKIEQLFPQMQRPVGISQEPPRQNSAVSSEEGAWPAWLKRMARFARYRREAEGIPAGEPLVLSGAGQASDFLRTVLSGRSHP